MTHAQERLPSPDEYGVRRVVVGDRVCFCSSAAGALAALRAGMAGENMVSACERATAGTRQLPYDDRR